MDHKILLFKAKWVSSDQEVNDEREQRKCFGVDPLAAKTIWGVKPFNRFERLWLESIHTLAVYQNF